MVLFLHHHWNQPCLVKRPAFALSQMALQAHYMSYGPLSVTRMTTLSSLGLTFKFSLFKIAASISHPVSVLFPSPHPIPSHQPFLRWVLTHGPRIYSKAGRQAWSSPLSLLCSPLSVASPFMCFTPFIWDVFKSHGDSGPLATFTGSHFSPQSDTVAGKWPTGALPNLI